MGRRLRMTAELGDWLTDLSESEPATAAEVGAAVVAVLDAAEPSSLATLGKLTTPYSDDPRETADYLYQQMLEELQQFRRGVSDVATARKRAELRLGKQRGAGAEGAETARLEQSLSASRQREERLTEQSQRLQWQVDAFRAAKEYAKAMYTVAETQLRTAGAMAALEGGGSGADTAQLAAALKDARERMERVAAQGTQTLHTLRAPRDQADGDADLLELRADPLGSEIRILLAVEPADTVTLLAVLEGPDAAREHGVDAVSLASDLLTEIHEDGWPADIDEVALADADAFVARYFPADDGSIRRRAGVLASPVNER